VKNLCRILKQKKSKKKKTKLKSLIIHVGRVKKIRYPHMTFKHKKKKQNKNVPNTGVYTVTICYKNKK